MPNETLGVRKSSRVKFQRKQDYIPIMIGSNYAIYVVQLEYYEALHTYTHILFMQMQEGNINTITSIITQL